MKGFGRSKKISSGGCVEQERDQRTGHEYQTVQRGVGIAAKALTAHALAPMCAPTDLDLLLGVVLLFEGPEPRSAVEGTASSAADVFVFAHCCFLAWMIVFPSILYARAVPMM